MAFQIQADQGIRNGVRRLACRQLFSAIAELGGPRRDDRIHDIRKRLKKVRALLRIARDSLGDKEYRCENENLRDAARPLTEVRDAHVLLDTLNKLSSSRRRAAKQASLAIQRGLETHRRKVRARVLDKEYAFSETCQRLTEACRRVDRWRLEHHGWRTVEPALRRAYKKGRAEYRRARAEPTAENLHEWRKQAKYLLYELEVITPEDAPKLRPLIERIRALTDRLGDDHDLVVLGQIAEADGDAFGGAAIVGDLLRRIRRRRKKLERQAFTLGRTSFKKSPGQLLEQLETRWRADRKKAQRAKA